MGNWYEQQTIGLLPERAALQWGAREALAFQGKRWSFSELSARVDATAKGLIRLGIGPGDKVALWMVNRPEWIDAMFAIMKIGAVLVPVNTRFRTNDMAYVLGQSDAVAMILAERSGPVDYLGMMREVVPSLGARPDARFPALRQVVLQSDRTHAPTVGWDEMLEAGRCVSDDVLRERARAVDPAHSAFFLSHGAIKGAAVVGLPAARLSEVAVAFVQVEPGFALTECEVIEHCRGRLASFKIPRHVAFVDEFPMTSTGKIQKVKLRERALIEWSGAAPL